MTFLKPVQAAATDHFRDAAAHIFGILRFSPQRVGKLVIYGIFDKQKLRILRQKTDPFALHAAAVRFYAARKRAQERGFSAAVTAENAQMFPRPRFDRRAAQHVLAVFLIAEPKLPRA